MWSDLFCFCGHPEFLCMLTGSKSVLGLILSYFDFPLGKSGVTICLATVSLPVIFSFGSSTPKAFQSTITMLGQFLCAQIGLSRD